MILTLLYHKVLYQHKYGNDPELFAKHLDYLKKHYTFSIPGKKTANPLSICLSFDDATFDFYHYVFPLLQKHCIPAVLAISTDFISQKTKLPPEKRLEQIKESSPENLSEQYCSWEELKIMTTSGLVIPASHGHQHVNLKKKPHLWEQEALISKSILEKQLQTPITSFVYPYGQFDLDVHKKISEHYSYIFRIGNCLNASWQHKNKLYYRCHADNLSSESEATCFMKLASYGIKLAYKRLMNRA